MHEKRFHRDLSTLRDPQRVSRLEVPRVVNLSLEDLANPASVLDIGAGTGLFSQEFAGHGLAVSGLDANPRALELAREFVPSGQFREGIAESLPFAENEFDLVFMGLVLHETDDLLKALQEARRVIKQRLAILEWPYEANEFGPPLKHRVSPEQIKFLGQKAGFKSIEQIALNELALYRLDC